MLVKTLKRSQQKYTHEKSEGQHRSTRVNQLRSQALSPLVCFPCWSKIHVGNEVACKSSYKSKRENCLRKELPETIKGLNFARVTSPKVNEFTPEGTKMIAKIILNSRKVTEIVNLLLQ